MDDELSLVPGALSWFVGLVGTLLFAGGLVVDIPEFWRRYPVTIGVLMAGIFLGALRERCALRGRFRAQANLVRAATGNTILGWRSAGRPRKGGFHEVPGLGRVWFDEEDIEDALAHKGRLAFRVQSSRAWGDARTEYTVIERIPL